MKTRDFLPIADNAGDSDIKGWALGWLFPIAEALTIMGEAVPEQWGYQPSPFVATTSLSDFDAEYGWEGSEVVAALGRPGGVEGVRYVGNVLDRYLDMFVRGTDRDY
jgi:hypothetical protein